MRNEVLLALLIKKVEERINDLSQSSVARGPRGPRGQSGKDGKGFIFSEHEETIRNWAKEFALKFTDLSAEQINSLRGPKGRDGKDGENGKDFSVEDHVELFKNLAQQFSLKFEDFTNEQIESLRGPKGRDGSDGESFNFSKHEEEIKSIISETVKNSYDSLKLTFSDLTEKDVEALRGPRGREGKDGKDFNFEDHKEFFLSLKPKFSDFTAEERNSLKLYFKDLTPEERSHLKLTFSDLTAEDRLSIKGARGPRGQRGASGEKGDRGIQGEKGERGIRGLPGVKGERGLSGPSGKDGRDGEDGKDAPYITDIRVDQYKSDEAEFIFELSNGKVITTNPVKLPRPNVFISGGGHRGGGGSGGGGTGEDGKSAYEIAVENGFSGTEVEWLASLKGDDGADGATGPAGPPGSGSPEISSIDCASDVFVGALVYLAKDNFVDYSFMSEWPDLDSLISLDFGGPYDTVARNALADNVETSDVFGIVSTKPTTTTCTISPMGEMSRTFTGLDVAKRYYLSDTVAGEFTQYAPTEIGHVKLRVGRAISPTRFLYDREYDLEVIE